MSRMIEITQGSIDNPLFNRETFSETPLLHPTGVLAALREFFFYPFSTASWGESTAPV
jgi:hypothetical protein